MPTIEDAKSVSHRIAAAVQPDKVILFGSLATGKASTYSDVDLLVVWDAPEDVSPRDRRIHLRRIVGITDVPVDILTCNRRELQTALEDPRSFTYHIWNTGLVLYG